MLRYSPCHVRTLRHIQTDGEGDPRAVQPRQDRAMTAPAHRGLAADDPRNAGPIAAFRPMDASPAQVQALMEASARRIANAKVREDMMQRARRVGQGALAPPPPL